MKNVVRALIFISISLAALNCTNDESIPVQGKVQFVLAITASSSDGGRVLSSSFPEGSYISLSIETASGASVYSLKKVDLIKLGDGYITSPLALAEGSYRLTDFLVTSADGEVLYATPKEGSPVAELVTDPLPISFSITPDGIVNLNVQVVDADQQTPEDFGYVSFGIEVTGSDFSIALFIEENNSLSYASGTLRIYQGTELRHEQNVSPSINRVNFKGNSNDTYTLVIEKEGYAIKTRTFVLHDLLNELDGRPLSIVLSPASTLTLLIKEPCAIEMQIHSDSDLIDVDWGDGNAERISSGELGFILHHDYKVTGRYFVNITGDLKSISDLRFVVTEMQIEFKQRIENVDITKMSGLKSFSLTWHGDVPKEIDFSHNTKLEKLILNFCSMERLDISNNPHLNYLSLNGTHIRPSGSVHHLTHVINVLSQHAVDNNIKGGYLNYGTFFIYEEPLTPELKAKLLNLVESLEWVTTQL